MSKNQPEVNVTIGRRTLPLGSRVKPTSLSDATDEFDNGNKVLYVKNFTPTADLVALANLVAAIPDSDRIRILECGAWVGESTLTIRHACLHHEELILYVCDHFRGSPEDPLENVAGILGPELLETLFRHNCAEYLRRGEITLIKEDSLTLAKRWAILRMGGPLDMIYLDNDHRYEHVKSELAAWWHHLKSGGIFAGHDYGDFLPGVRKAVNEFAKKMDMKVNLIKGSTVWYIRKP